MGFGTVIEMGWRAAEVLGHGAPDARVLTPLHASIYIVVRGEILWLGGPAHIIHPRAILLSEPPEADAYLAGQALDIPPVTARVWRPEALVAGPRSAAGIRQGSAWLARIGVPPGRPQGFGRWLVGEPLAFPLADAGNRADALAAACAADDAQAAARAAVTLLGLGSGLTPSGDDFVGGAFFARAALAEVGDSDGAKWRPAAESVRAAAGTSTHSISAALLGDLLNGHGWSPLHDLARALAAEDESAAGDAAGRLTRLGHSSGWDVLAGFVAGAAR